MLGVPKRFLRLLTELIVYSYALVQGGQNTPVFMNPTFCAATLFAQPPNSGAKGEGVNLLLLRARVLGVRFHRALR